MPPGNSPVWPPPAWHRPRAAAGGWRAAVAALLAVWLLAGCGEDEDEETITREEVCEHAAELRELAEDDKAIAERSDSEDVQQMTREAAETAADAWQQWCDTGEAPPMLDAIGPELEDD